MGGIDKYFREDAVSLVLSKLSDALRSVESDSYDEDPDVAYWQKVFDAHIADSLLGAAFVLCQTYLSEIVSYAIARDEQCWNRYQRQLPSAMDGHKDRILAVGEPKIQNTAYNIAETINAFANYFKHRDEWSPTTLASAGRVRCTYSFLPNSMNFVLQQKRNRVR